MRHAYGTAEQLVDVDALPELIAELASSDEEHGDVSISLESGWTLSAHRDGSVVWGNVEGDEEPRHLVGVTGDEMVKLFRLVAERDVGRLESLPWRVGYPSSGSIS